jgi:predicted metal-dependent hydrolase
MTKITQNNHSNIIFANHHIKINYTSRKNTIALKISPKQEIIILAPKNISDEYLINFLTNKENWIKEKLAANHIKKINKNHAYIFGNETKIISKKSDKNYFNYENQEIIFYYKEHLSKAQIVFLFNEFIKNTSRSYLQERFIILSNITNFRAEKLTLKHNISKWGSCSSKKVINLSYNLIGTKKTVIDYVIIHELCHLREMNHSQRFWKLVAKFCPDYKLENKWLRNHNFLINQADHLELST